MSFERVSALANELDQLRSTAESSDDAELRSQVVLFIKNVCDEAEKAFGDIDVTLGRISSLPEAPSESTVRKLQRDLLSTYSKEKFKQVQKICDRLDELGQRYEQEIKPRLGDVHVQRGSQLFWLLERHEGAFIYTIETALNDLSQKLAQYRGGGDIIPIRQAATNVQTDLRNAVGEMRRIRVGAEALEPGGASRLLVWNRVADEVLRKSPWFSGSFYLATLAALIAGLTWVSGTLDAVRFVLVAATALVGLTVVGALQLRNDGRLSEAGFLTLIELSLRRVFLPIMRRKQ